MSEHHSNQPSGPPWARGGAIAPNRGYGGWSEGRLPDSYLGSVPTIDLKLMVPGSVCRCQLRDLGPADTWRGRAVRAFFTVMRLWPLPRP